MKEIQNLSEEKQQKKDNMIVKDAKISQKMKNKSWLSIEKIPYYSYKKLFHLEKKKISQCWIR